MLSVIARDALFADGRENLALGRELPEQMELVIGRPDVAGRVDSHPMGDFEGSLAPPVGVLAVFIEGQQRRLTSVQDVDLARLADRDRRDGARERGALTIAAVQVARVDPKLHAVAAADLGDHVLDVPVQRAASSQGAAADARIGPDVEIGRLGPGDARGQPDRLCDPFIRANSREREQLPTDSYPQIVEEGR